MCHVEPAPLSCTTNRRPIGHVLHTGVSVHAVPCVYFQHCPANAQCCFNHARITCCREAVGNIPCYLALRFVIASSRAICFAIAVMSICVRCIAPCVVRDKASKPSISVPMDLLAKIISSRYSRACDQVRHESLLAAAAESDHRAQRRRRSCDTA